MDRKVDRRLLLLALLASAGCESAVIETTTAQIDVRTRRIDLPADWMVSVSPAQVSLAPGAQTTVTVTVAPGSLVPQGTIPRLAVEGYVGSLLLGGVAIDIVVPQYVAFAPYHTYLPLVSRQ